MACSAYPPPSSAEDQFMFSLHRRDRQNRLQNA